jgi:peptidoglycan/LPS O-acetylase OafA/YrhL
MNDTLKNVAQKSITPLRQAIREAYQTQFYPLGYVPALDGMRGLMTLGVVVGHVYLGYVPGTVLYLDVFFAASAYYITSLLLRDIERDGRIDYREFYRRRFARILPPLLAMIAAYLLFRWFFLPPFSSALAHSAIVLSYISNYWYIFDPKGIEDLVHTWTLSVEEQFYILWPVTFAFLVSRLGVTWRLVKVIGMIAAAVWAWRAGLNYYGAPWQRLYHALDTRADALMCGSALAVILKLVPPQKHSALDRLWPKLAWPLLLYWVAITFFFWPFQVSQSKYYYFGSILCGVIPGILALTVLIRSSGTICHRIFERPEAVFVGRIFYAVYLWHFPIVYFMFIYGFQRKYVLFFGLPLSLLIATLSYAYVERHFMRQRRSSNQKLNSIVDEAKQGPNASSQKVSSLVEQLAGNNTR